MTTNLLVEGFEELSLEGLQELEGGRSIIYQVANGVGWLIGATVKTIFDGVWEMGGGM